MHHFQAWEGHRAEFNATLQQRIAECRSWRQLAGIVAELLQESDSRGLVNYISVSLLCERLGALPGPGHVEGAGKEAAGGEALLHTMDLAFERVSVGQE